MKRIRVVGMAVIAALALTAFAASSASALPELGKCVKVTLGTGKYTDSNCLKKSSTKVPGEFEWKKGTVGIKELNFVSAGGTGTLETASGTKISCTTESGKGKYKGTETSVKEVTAVTVTFKGCELSNPKNKCNTTGAAVGEIVTNALKGKLGYINKTTKEVGEELTPQAGKTAKFVEFGCGPVTVQVGVKKKEVTGEIIGNDCIIAPIEPANTMAKLSTLTYAGSGGKQIPEGFYNAKKNGKGELEKPCHLESHIFEGTEKTPFESSTQTIISTVEAANGEEDEIKA